jgi:signal transduction histidine kinase
MRLAATYIAAFAVAVAVLGLTAYFVTTAIMERQLDARVENEARQLAAIESKGGLAALTDAVRSRERHRPSGVRAFALAVQGTRVAGTLDAWPKRAGWSALPDSEPDSESSTLRVFVAELPAGVTLAIAADRERVEDVKEAIFDGFLSAFGAVLVLGIGGGLGLSFIVLRRVEAIRRTAQAIIDGDLSRRIPVRGTGDDFDRLSQTLNQMLDRIGELMSSLRQVSANIAHDLKTPLARLHQRLETSQAMLTGADRARLTDAIAQVDEILATFSALLRIAQIEAGTRRAGFAPVALSETFATLADAFKPAAEDAAHTLTATIEPGLMVTGDRELITQMLANVIENAIHHTPPGTRIDIALRRGADGIVGSIADNGLGVPSADRERIFDRFFRLPRSHSVPGNGLGLSLVKAVADIHGITIIATDAGPGLRLALRFPEGTAAEARGPMTAARAPAPSPGS